MFISLLNELKNNERTKAWDEYGLSPQPKMSSFLLRVKPLLDLLCFDSDFEFTDGNRKQREVVRSKQKSCYSRTSRELNRLRSIVFFFWIASCFVVPKSSYADVISPDFTFTAKVESISESGEVTFAEVTSFFFD